MVDSTNLTMMTDEDDYPIIVDDLTLAVLVSSSGAVMAEVCTIF